MWSDSGGYNHYLVIVEDIIIILCDLEQQLLKWQIMHF